MKLTQTVPADDGYRMPGEFEPHRGCLMIWPVRPGSWPYGAKEAQKAFTRIACAIAESEHVWMLAAPSDVETVEAHFASEKNISVLPIQTDDAWARDVGPTFVKGNALRGIDWSFNAWGGSYDGLYADWDQDDAAASKICDALQFDYYDAKHFVLEGGAIHTDGEGTLLVTEACLLSQGRNPMLGKARIEEQLRAYLGVEKIVWLPHGIWKDETNEHVDNICAFVRPGEVVLAWTDNKDDPQWEYSRAALQVLESETDAKGRPFVVHKLPIPEVPVCITAEELDGFVFAEGEDQREAGERLAASYVNFYIANGSVIVPQFGDAMDEIAVDTLKELFPDRVICPVFARPIIVGGGNIHCITQQIPL